MVSVNSALCRLILFISIKRSGTLSFLTDYPILISVDIPLRADVLIKPSFIYLFLSSIIMSNVVCLGKWNITNLLTFCIFKAIFVRWNHTFIFLQTKVGVLCLNCIVQASPVRALSSLKPTTSHLICRVKAEQALCSSALPSFSSFYSSFIAVKAKQIRLSGRKNK